MNEPGCYRVPLDRYPGMNRFVLDWLAGDERFLPRAPAKPGGAPPPASAALLGALIESNRRWGLDIHKYYGQEPYWDAKARRDAK